MPDPNGPSQSVSSEFPKTNGSPDIDPADRAREDSTNDDRGQLPIVGLGGSAGALAALQAFFAGMPADSGMAFVVVLHLSPEHESILAELLQRVTSMPVRQVQERLEVQPNHVYVIPPGKHLSMAAGALTLSDFSRHPGHHVAVDLFFRALADTRGPNAAAIVLSGADSDGALGIKRIKECGGLTIAQNPDESEHVGMPRASIATGMVDWIVNASEMPAKLIQYWRAAERLQIPQDIEEKPAEPERSGEAEIEATLHEILGFLRVRTGHDFTYYKRATILRRIARRMQVNGVETAQTYFEFIRAHPGEPDALLRDLLISVTNFFRDREAFDSLELLIPSLFQGKRPEEAVRVWIPACATGEEAYSLAMMLSEYAATLDRPPLLQVFATDLDERAIRVAREGLYPDTIVADVGEDRLRRFFGKEHGGYRIKREIREIVLFAIHDLLKDSPFSRLDLIACRNLLIYLNRDAQNRALDIFHFALRPEGYLFLGSSESVDDDNSLFRVVEKKRRIYSRRPGSRAGLPISPEPSALMRSMIRAAPAPNAGAASREHLFAFQPKLYIPGPAAASGDVPLSWSSLHYDFLEKIAPPSVLINKDHVIVHVSEHAGRFLQVAGGEASMNLLQMVHPVLRIELRTALYQAAESGKTVQSPGVPMEIAGQQMQVQMRIIPGAPDREFLIVLFQQHESTAAQPAPALAPPAEAESLIRQLERELSLAKSQLRDVIEHSEASGEELKAANEELQAMNEELRSAGEELETGREELQSVNEELSTLNQELKSNVDELSRSNSDLQNLMAATQIATVFLDRDLCIQRYTPPAVALFNLIPSDVGRPLSDLTPRLNYQNLTADAAQVLGQFAVIETEVSHTDGRYFLARLLPYWTTADQIGGVVMTFVDITLRRQAEKDLRESEERLRLLIENAREFAIFSMDLDLRVTVWNSGAENLLGYAEKEIIGRSGEIIFTPEDRAAGVQNREAAQALSEGRAIDARWQQRKDGSRFWASGAMMPMREQHGEAIGFVKILRDETLARESREALEHSREELIAALKETESARAEAVAAGRAKDHFLAVLSHELRTPLTPVALAVRMMGRQQNLSEAAREQLAMIERNVKIEAHLIDDLLDITRISRGKLEIEREPMDIHQAVRQALEISAMDIRAKNQGLTVSLDAAAHMVNGDIRRLRQVFWNLLKNASKFTPENGSIRILSRNEPGKVIIEVSDSGIGFEPKTATQIFEAFMQASKEISREFGGLGLGLAISKATVDAHDGTLIATSEGANRGATFTVTLPVLA